ncbi:hypothetical protein [Prevotella intermedia]|uniref:hypothetical protein n=1 Tax=Prevotella intermedia TaxID=28131 RepID=UPI002005435C|nr:hypothetical protein [Prevotella intermedia]MCK6144201.1 hypothetical protein [Prevotella intermedia]
MFHQVSDTDLAPSNVRYLAAYSAITENGGTRFSAINHTNTHPKSLLTKDKGIR